MIYKTNIVKISFGLGFLVSIVLLINSTNKSGIVDDPDFKIESIFANQRFPNLGIALDGTIIATAGSESVVARLSKDGGETWGSQITIAKNGIHGGGLIVDDLSGDVLVFVQDRHPPAEAYIYRSKDHGETWEKEEISV